MAALGTGKKGGKGKSIDMGRGIFLKSYGTLLGVKMETWEKSPLSRTRSSGLTKAKSQSENKPNHTLAFLRSLAV